MMACFFFQAEDGIRDYKVTGVQTCALPICRGDVRVPAADFQPGLFEDLQDRAGGLGDVAAAVRGPVSGAGPGVPGPFVFPRSEERRVGKECRSRWSPYH